MQMRRMSLLAVLLVLSAGVGSLASSGCAGEDCSGYENQVSDDPALTITIENQGSEAIFLPSAGDCTSNLNLTIADSAGALNWRSSGITCESLTSGGCVSAQDAGACLAGPAIRLEPGGVYSTSWDRTAGEQVDMPRDCFARPKQCGPTCVQRVAVDGGDHTFSIQGGGPMAACEEPGNEGACECTPNSDGWCEVWDFWDAPSDPVTASATVSLPDADSVAIIFE